MTEIAPAPYNPVPLREFASHLRLAYGFTDDGSEDALLELYLRNAVAAIERRTSLALVNRAFRVEVASWDRHGGMILPVGPVNAITAVSILGLAGTMTLDPARLTLDPGTSRQRLTGAALAPIPAGARAVIEFEAGFGATWNAVPDDLRQAVMMLAGHYYENRLGEDQADRGLPHGITGLLDSYRPVRL